MPKPTWTGKSPWNVAMDKLQNDLHINYNIESVNDDISLQNLFNAIMDIYDKRNAEFGSVQSTDNLQRMMSQSFTIFSLDERQKRDLRININRGAVQYELDHDLAIKPAPVLPIPKMMELVWKLWNPDTNEKVHRGSLYKRRAAATTLAICAFTGNRWIDTCR